MSLLQMIWPGLSSRAKLRLSWLFIALIGSLLFLSSCATSPSTKTQVKSTPAVKIKPSPTQTSSNGATSTGDTTQSLRNLYDDIASLHRLEGPQGWMWRVTLPANRLVIYYGNPFSSAIGPIGAYSDDELLARLQQQAQAYADLDPEHAVITAFDYVTPVAQASPIAEGTWSARIPDR